MIGDMPPKKKNSRVPSGNDRHLSRNMVRLSDELHLQLKACARKNRRLLTSEVAIALEEYLQKHGFWPPPATPEH